MASQAKRVTLYDVANRSGVSYQTVSRVINEHPHVSKETRQRVLRVIKELDYHPNRAARSLVTRRSYTLEIITFGNTYYGPAQMVASVESAARQLGYNLAISNVGSATPEDIREAMDSVGGRLVDGIVMIMPISDVPQDELATLCLDIPFVLIDTELGANIPSVVIDQRYGTLLATQHLIRLGHRHICEITGPLNWFGARARHESWLNTLRNADLTPGDTVEGDWTAVSGYEGIQSLLDRGAHFTAVVAGNDHIALGAIRALREHGLRVPQDVSVVGFDNMPETAFYEPPLTTVHQDFDALGKHSVEYLVNLLRQPDGAVHQRVLYPYLVERQSTCPPATP